MENNTAILNASIRKINFRFKNEDFEVDLTEGDLDDNWNTITESESGEVWDFSFGWEDTKNSIPNLYIYGVENNMTNTNDYTKIEIVEQIGKRSDYFKEVRFKYRFNSSLPMIFRGYDKDGKQLIKTRSANDASDCMANSDGGIIIATDSNFATKRIK